MQKLVIFDGNAIIHRAYHAIPPLTTKDGVMVNAVYGFTSMLLKVWKDLKPDCIAVTFDMAGPTFRHVQYKEYKATRVKADQALYDQIPLVHEVVEAFGLPIYEKKGYEADDVIGTIAKHFEKKKDAEVFIVTGDMDTLQLVRDNVKVYTLRKGISDIVIYDVAGVKARFGFGPEKMIDYKALRGDASDNIPGVPGIGEKTALELILKFGSVENIYKQLKNREKIAKELKPGVIAKLVEGEDSAKMSKELSTIDCDVPDLKFDFKHCEIGEFDKEKISHLFQKFEFVSLLKRIPGFQAEEEKTEKHKNTEKMIFSEIDKESELEKLFKLVKEKKSFACRAVLSGKEVLDSEFLGLMIVVGHQVFFVDAKITKKVLPLFADKDIELVGHDLKELIKALQYNFNVVPENALFDVMVASYLLSSGTRAHDITSILLKVLGKILPQNTAQTSLFGIDKKSLAEELFLINQAKEKLKTDLEKAGNFGLFQKMEMQLEYVLAEMELNGIAVDKAMFKKLSVEAKESLEKLTKKIYKLAGMEFNIASPVQLREVLFDKLDLSAAGIKKGKTGLSTSAEELEKLHGLHPIIEEISAYRELAKLQNTYIDVLPDLVNKKTGRIHSHFNQTVAATGRLSSLDPNLQNIPIRSELGREIRKAFIAEPGNTLVSADYSQIELRIVASLAQDKRMIEIFNKDEDIHKATAAAINNVPLSEVTKEMRYAAKEVNFGVLYGMGSYGLSWRAGISQFEARDFIKKYFEAFSGVREYIDRTLEFTKKEGYCETLFGRRRYLPELNASNFQMRAAAERMAVNHPIQGTAADLMKMAMIEVAKGIKDAFCHPRKNGDPVFNRLDSRFGGNDNCPKILLQVHDELVLEVKKELAEEVANLVKNIMENVVTLRVPVKVGLSINRSWGEMK
ncbi:MAG: DNA polymerase I [Candidatus Magasanikbacteria bacterium]|nr:DNA polymerase I [Candidatus Magasanikbacteria bacterium]